METKMTDNFENAPFEAAKPPPLPAAGGNRASEPEKSGGKGGRGCLFLVILFSGIFILGSALLIFAGIVTLLFNLPSLPALHSFKPSPYFEEEFIEGDYFSRNKIVVLDIRGVIMDAAGSSYYSCADAQTICDQIKYATEDASVKAVILKINSPGGEVVASDIIHHHVMELKKKARIPVIASMDSMAASGGYYIAVASDHIVANRMTMTGSIGVIIETYKYHDLFAKVGVQSEIYKSGQMKDLLDGSRPSTEAEKKIVQKMVTDTYNEFVKIVAAGRPGLTEEHIKTTKIGDGRVFSGEEALELNLVDSLGFFQDAVKKAAEKASLSDYQVIRYQEPFSFAKLFSQTRAASKVHVSLPGTEKKAVLESGKLYFLPTVW